MRKTGVNDWVQIVTGLAIVIGLIMVFWELQQAREIAKAQLISESYSSVVSQRTTLMGENPAHVINKACLHPAELTGEDMEILNSYYWNMLSTPMRMREIGIKTELYTPDEWQSYYPGLFGVIAGTAYGRHWWKAVSTLFERINPDVAAFGNDFVANYNDGVLCSTVPENYLNQFSATPDIE